MSVRIFQPPVDETLVFVTLRALFRCMAAVGACFVRRPRPPLIFRDHPGLAFVKTGICGRRPTVNQALIFSVVAGVVLTANCVRSLSFLQAGNVDCIS